MRRREFLWTAPVVSVVGGCAVRADMVPWLLWGSSEVVRVPITSGSGQRLFQSQQLAKIAYGRPESWLFWFTAEIVNSNPVSYGFDVFRACANFDIRGGIGRTFYNTEGQLPASGGLPATLSFAQFRWDRAPGVAIVPQSLKWTTKGRTPVLDEVAAGALPQEVDCIVAQDIQASVRLEANMATPTPGQFIDVRVGMFFAPRTHIRPDWYQVDGTPFAGGETGGR